MNTFQLNIRHVPAAEDTQYGRDPDGCRLRIIGLHNNGKLKPLVTVYGRNCFEPTSVFGSILTQNASGLDANGVLRQVAAFSRHTISPEDEEKLAAAMIPIVRENLTEQLRQRPHPDAARIGAAIMDGTFGAGSLVLPTEQVLSQI